MRVLIAPDKFKGSLTAAEVADHLAKGLAEAGAHSRTLPLADGGDGSVAAALASGFHPLPVDVHGATGENHRGVVAFDADTAIVEVANTCGLATLPGGVRAPMTASSYGFGEAIRAALRCPVTAWCSRSAAAPAPTAASECSPRWATASSTGQAISLAPTRREPGPHPLRRLPSRRQSQWHRDHRGRRRDEPAARTDRRRRRVRPPKGRHRSPSRATRRRPGEPRRRLHAVRQAAAAPDPAAWAALRTGRGKAVEDSLGSREVVDAHDPGTGFRSTLRMLSNVACWVSIGTRDVPSRPTSLT